MHLVWSKYGAYTGGIFRGQTAGKGAYSMEFYTELRRSDRVYIVCTKGISYALNQSVKPPLP